MAHYPTLHASAAPDAPRRQRDLGRREVLMLTRDLIGSLSRHAKHLRNLGHADQVMAHGAKYICNS